MHSFNVTHRDMKPANIFLKSHNYTVQVGDLGIATKTEAGTKQVEKAGTLLYQAPELLHE